MGPERSNKHIKTMSDQREILIMFQYTDIQMEMAGSVTLSQGC